MLYVQYTYELAHEIINLITYEIFAENDFDKLPQMPSMVTEISEQMRNGIPHWLWNFHLICQFFKSVYGENLICNKVDYLMLPLQLICYCKT